mmetsp:Transcript_16513/g.39021  ORF Transcript_16513/g.39021 Transcript_16513/m.39021 type:complete len:282 (+) Transcript_16513:100-945(+)
MSRERTDTAGSSSSFGLRERSHTNGSMEMILESGAPTNMNSPAATPKRSSRVLSGSPVATGPAASSSYLKHWVDWVQRQPVPAFVLPPLKRFLVGFSADHDDTRTVMCIRGLDRVVFGTAAAADCVVLMGIQPPRYLWYMLSGAFCDVFQLLVDITLHLTIFPNDAALCWMSSFVLSIVARHTSHRYLVFGDYVPSYWQSLGRMYAGYSISIVLSTIFNYLITTGVAKVSHYVAYIFTLLWTGLANYFILKRLWKMGGPTPPGVPPTTNARTSSSSSSAAP